VSSFALAVASGKGGTGKTTVAVALALALARSGESVSLLDADAEAPNGRLFMKPEWHRRSTVHRLVPHIDSELCDGCGICGRVCAFKAIAVLGGTPLVFPELCASCGACTRLCPAGAIDEHLHPVGTIETGIAKRVDFTEARLNVGEARVVPLIEALRRYQRAEGTTIIDAPPGTSCPTLAAVRGVDYLMLVTEPTAFGAHDLALAVEAAVALDIPHGIIINRAGLGGPEVHDFARSKDIPILLEIPFDRGVAECYATGGTLIDAQPALEPVLADLVQRVRSEVTP
jgi:MinD superfamily P-loop ATPase